MIERLVPPDGVRPAAGVPLGRGLAACGAGFGVDAAAGGADGRGAGDGRAAGAGAGDGRAVEGGFGGGVLRPPTGVAVVGLMFGRAPAWGALVPGALAPGAGRGGSGRGGTDGSCRAGSMAADPARAPATGGAPAARLPARTGGGMRGGRAWVARVAGAAGAVALPDDGDPWLPLPVERMAEPGIGGVSFGNDGRADAGTTGGRPLVTNAVAGVGCGTRGGGVDGGVTRGAASGGADGGVTRGAASGGADGGGIGRGAAARAGAAGAAGVAAARAGVDERDVHAGVVGLVAAGLAGVTGRAGVAGRAGVTDRGVRRTAGSKVTGAASASDSISARSVLSHDASPAPTPTGCSCPTWMTAPHTEQRARTPPTGTFAGSTRNTDWHSTHETFKSPPTH